MSTQTCIFCSYQFQPGRRGEDVISNWYAKRAGYPDCFVVTGTADASGTVTPSQPRKSQTPAAQEFRLDRVCRSDGTGHQGCNDGWMSTVERTAMPFVTGLMDGTPALLDAAAIEVIATWAQLKAITYDALCDTPVLAPAIAHTFYKTRPLATVGVTIGSFDGQSRAEVTLARQRGTAPIELASQPGPVAVARVTMVFHHLVLSVVAVGGDRLPIAMFVPNGMDELTSIWPAFSTAAAPVDWPPPVQLTRETLAQFF